MSFAIGQFLGFLSSSSKINQTGLWIFYTLLSFSIVCYIYYKIVDRIFYIYSRGMRPVFHPKEKGIDWFEITQQLTTLMKRTDQKKYRLIAKLWKKIPQGSYTIPPTTLIAFLENMNLFRLAWINSLAGIYGINLLYFLLLLRGITQDTLYKSNLKLNARRIKNRCKKANSVEEKVVLFDIGDYFEYLDETLVYSINYLRTNPRVIVKKKYKPIKNWKELARVTWQFVKLFHQVYRDVSAITLLRNPDLISQTTHFINLFDYFVEIKFIHPDLILHEKLVDEIERFNLFDPKFHLYILLKGFSSLDEQWYKTFHYYPKSLLLVMIFYWMDFFTKFAKFYNPKLNATKVIVEKYEGYISHNNPDLEKLFRIPPLIDLQSKTTQDIINFESDLNRYTFSRAKAFKSLLKGSGKLIWKKAELKDFIAKFVSFNPDPKYLKETFKQDSPLEKISLREGELEAIIQDLSAIPPFSIDRPEECQNLIPAFFEVGTFYVQGPFNLLDQITSIMEKKLALINDNQKQFVLVDPVKSLLEIAHFQILPFSGVHFFDQNGEDCGELDVVANKNDILLLIECKIDASSQTRPENLVLFNGTPRSIMTNVKKFVKNIEIFREFCSNPDSAIRPKDQELKPLNLDVYREIYTIYLDLFPIYFPVNQISTLSNIIHLNYFLLAMVLTSTLPELFIKRFKNMSMQN